MRLMIIDDHPPAREMIRNFLNLPGVLFCECGSGEEAVQRAKEFKPHWVTMDINMPGLNGFQTTQALRAEHPPARVIILTSYNEEHYRKLSREVGAVALLNKSNLMALRIMLTREMGGPPAPMPSAVD
jgi:DNA-binding NarL/FixJ family response regulator